MCSSLNISCSTDSKTTLESAISAEEFIWFEDEKRNVEDDILREKGPKDYQLCPGVKEFVWFEDGDEEPKDKIEMLSKEIIENGLFKHIEKVFELNEQIDEQFEEVVKSNESIDKQVEKILKLNTNMII